jgi:hypothetical protein
MEVGWEVDEGFESAIFDMSVGDYSLLVYDHHAVQKE